MIQRLRTRFRQLPKWLRGILIAGALIALVVALQTAYIVGDGLRDELGKADLIVVFGNKVELNGQPSDRLRRLRARLVRTAEVYRMKLAPLILVSGGVGKEGFDEAVVMRDWLVAEGIPVPAIVLDQVGLDSRKTATATARLLNERKLKSVIIVTQYWHITRSKIAMHRAGIETVYSTHARYFDMRDLYSICREVPAVWKYLLF